MANNAIDRAAGTPALPPSPLIAGESTRAYDDLFARMSASVKPADIFEEVWLRDVVDLAWDVLRLRRMKTHLLQAGAHEGVSRVLGPILDAKRHGGLPKACDSLTVYDLSRRWSARDRAAMELVDALLGLGGLSMDAVMAQTLVLRIKDIERIERLMMAAEARRDTALSRIERRRATFAQRLRGAIRDTEDAEFSPLPLPPPQAGEGRDGEAA